MYIYGVAKSSASAAAAVDDCWSAGNGFADLTRGHHARTMSADFVGRGAWLEV